MTNSHLFGENVPLDVKMDVHEQKSYSYALFSLLLLIIFMSLSHDDHLERYEMIFFQYNDINIDSRFFVYFMYLKKTLSQYKTCVKNELVLQVAQLLGMDLAKTL